VSCAVERMQIKNALVSNFSRREAHRTLGTVFGIASRLCLLPNGLVGLPFIRSEMATNVELPVEHCSDVHDTRTRERSPFWREPYGSL
jgi:hypothetical protein